MLKRNLIVASVAGVGASAVIGVLLRGVGLRHSGGHAIMETIAVTLLAFVALTVAGVARGNDVRGAR